MKSPRCVNEPKIPGLVNMTIMEKNSVIAPQKMYGRLRPHFDLVLSEA